MVWKFDGTVKFPMAGWRPWGTANTFVTTNQHDFKWPVSRVDMCGHLPPTGKYARAFCPELDCRNVCLLQPVCLPQYYEVPVGGACFQAPAGMVCVEVPDACVALCQPRAGLPAKGVCRAKNSPCCNKLPKKCYVPTGFSEYQDRYGCNGARIWSMLRLGCFKREEKVEKTTLASAPPCKPCVTPCEVKPEKYLCTSANTMSPCPPIQSITHWRVYPYSVWPERESLGLNAVALSRITAESVFSDEYVIAQSLPGTQQEYSDHVLTAEDARHSMYVSIFIVFLTTVVVARVDERLRHLTWGKKWKDFFGGNIKQRPPWRPPNGWCTVRRRPIRPHCTCRPASASELTRVAPTAAVGDGDRAERPTAWPSPSLYRELRRRHHPHCPLLRHLQDSHRRYLSPSASSSSASSLSSGSSSSLSGSRSSRSSSSRSQLLLYPWPQPSQEEWRGGMPPLRPRSASLPLDCAFFRVVPANCRDVSSTDGDSQQPDVIPSRHRQPRHRNASDCSYIDAHGDIDARPNDEPASVLVPPFALHYPIGSDADTAARQRNPPFRADLKRYAFQPPKRAFDNRAGPKTPYALDYPYGSKWDRKNRNRMAPGKLVTKRNKFKSGVVPDIVNNARHRSEKGDRSEKEQDDSSNETATNTNRRREISESRSRTCKLTDNKNEPYDYMDYFPWLSPDRPEEYQGNKKTMPTTHNRKELERSRRGRRRADDSDTDQSSSRSRSSTSFKACFATVLPNRRAQRSRALQPAVRAQAGTVGSDVGAKAQRQSRWGAARRGQGRRGAARGYDMFARRHRHKNYKEPPGYDVSVSQVEKEMFVYTYPTDTAPKTGPSFVAAPAGGSTVVPLHNCLEMSPCTYNRYHQQGWAWRPPAVMALTHLAAGQKKDASPSPSRPRKQSRVRPRTRSRAPPRHASPDRATSIK